MRLLGESTDPRELERFRDMGSRWWDRDGPMRPLHNLNPTRIDWIRARLAKQLLQHPAVAGKLTILDIGCGGGLLSEPLARLGARVTAIDPNPELIDIARSHARGSGLDIDYQATTAEALAASGISFDVVCAMEVIEHVVDPAAFVAVSGSLLRPGGQLLGATLNRTLKSFGLAILGAEYVLGWVPKGTHQWEKFVTPDEFENHMENAGLRVVERTGLVYSPLGDRWKLSPDLAVNYMMAGVRED